MAHIAVLEADEHGRVVTWLDHVSDAEYGRRTRRRDRFAGDRRRRGDMSGSKLLWLDVSAGVAGDMLLAALVDAGASLGVVRGAVAAVVGDAVELRTEIVTRAGLRATRLVVTERDRQTHRPWRDIQELLRCAPLDDAVRAAGLAVFTRLAEAEGHVHATDPADVHFHEVGGLDAVADVVGTCAALADLGVTDVVAGPLALGSGTVTTRHGTLPVPAPAVLEMVGGWTVSATGDGELATPTGVALVTALARGCAPLPPMTVAAVGVGAGTRDTPGRANVVRAVVGVAADAGPPEGASRETLLEANIDDLDPRAWPSVLEGLLGHGANDAWLTPILMKKGRPAHTLHVLAPPGRVDALRRLILSHTSTLGVRSGTVEKYALPRAWVAVDVGGGQVRVKVAGLDGTIVQSAAEYEDVASVARALGVPVRDVLRAADVAAARAGLVPGGPMPAPDARLNAQPGAAT